MIKTVVMAGGSGSRLWPLTRSLYPKQFQPLADSQTMLQATLSRVRGLSVSEPMLICNEENRFIAAEQVRQQGVKVDILLEPVGRNTAPAIAVAALTARAKGDDPLLLVLAANHVIQNESEFRAVVSSAQPLAEAGRLVTFGIVATVPETGYGYIRRGAEQGAGYAVAEFVDKPDLERAEGYVASASTTGTQDVSLQSEPLSRGIGEIPSKYSRGLQRGAVGN